ncbi:putative NTE family protein YlbK [Geobacter sp. OR-1]|uniref:patatin-like phospholipase family protein n=1 Tax=Geobacter sp. OR-1 TaxID=1266765 RepID=UPI000543B340|nr:patatin-like phospholipase family protein [Geobacter sp. OR-1]GAM11269.1 putative NTE family protein YlbK [Geobacter sp. OR-1]
MSERHHADPKTHTPVDLNQPVTLLLLGGGIRFPALVGALRAVEAKGIKVAKVVGSSAGSIVGAMYAAGMTPDELSNEVMALEPSRFKDVSVRRIFTGFGLCTGDSLEEWVDEKLQGRRFRDDFRMPVQMIATDILNYKPVIFSAASHPELKVSAAARFSTGVPWVFTCKHFEHQGKKHVLVDGLLMAGAVEESYGRSNEQILILKVVSKRTLRHEIEDKLTLSRYFREMLNFSLHAMEKEFIKGGRWRDTILLYCSEIEPARFTLSTEEKVYLMTQGYEQTMRFLEYKWGI